MSYDEQHARAMLIAFWGIDCPTPQQIANYIIYGTPHGNKGN